MVFLQFETKKINWIFLLAKVISFKKEIAIVGFMDFFGFDDIREEDIYVV